jgi:hypothetical protein
MIASKGAFTPEVIERLPVKDFWTWMEAFGRFGEMQQEEMDRIAARER